MTLGTRTLLLLFTEASLTAPRAAAQLGASLATASSTLARLYWAGTIDRTWNGRAYVYTPRAAKASTDAAA